MSYADFLDAHQARCDTRLARLRMLADGEAGAVPGGQVAAEVREATNAVIAAAEAAGQAALAAGTHAGLEAETFLWVRLARLAATADEAANAACTSDTNRLRQHLQRFDDLARAMWAVQRALYVQVPFPRPRDSPSPAPLGIT